MDSDSMSLFSCHRGTNWTFVECFVEQASLFNSICSLFYMEFTSNQHILVGFCVLQNDFWYTYFICNYACFWKSAMMSVTWWRGVTENCQIFKVEKLRSDVTWIYILIPSMLWSRFLGVHKSCHNLRELFCCCAAATIVTVILMRHHTVFCWIRCSWYRLI